MTFRIEAQPWLASDTGPKELRETLALISIVVNEHTASRAEDIWSRSVTERVPLGAWPLAMWLAGNWWRLRWEPIPAGRPSPDWRMAHHLPAAGHGFVWPHLEVASDGETVAFRCDPSPANARHSYGYLSSFASWVPAEEFETGVDTFVDQVLARMSAREAPDNELAALWREVRRERADGEASAYRRLEAALGFDPDDAPPELLKKLLRQRSQMGPLAVEEIAPVCNGPDPDATLRKILRMDQVPAVVGRPDLPPVAHSTALPQGPPWVRGHRLAAQLRQDLGLGTAPVASSRLSGLLGIEASRLDDQSAPTGLPIGLAIRQDADRARYVFRKRPSTGRRFEAARWIAEVLTAGSMEKWLPSTDGATARQKFQRAFAAELLAPIATMRERLNADYSEAAIDDAAEYFQVSPVAILSHLANHGDIHPERVALHGP